ncbi:hypothetical protein J6V86_03425 [bacterium]|nr:hypothetical protein [bacterium]
MSDEILETTEYVTVSHISILVELNLNVTVGVSASLHDGKYIDGLLERYSSLSIIHQSLS